jgi:hypothetical protein
MCEYGEESGESVKLLSCEMKSKYTTKTA